MEIQVNTDNNVEGDANLERHTRENLAIALDRFASRLTRLEVHLGNQSAGRSTGEDFRCLIEARPAGMGPVAATNLAATLPEAIHGATEKLEALLSSKFDRLDSLSAREATRGH